MGTSIFNRTTKMQRAWQRSGTPDYDPDAEVAVTVPEPPDIRTVRWDDADGIRPATAQELADADAAALEEDARASTDGDKVRRLIFAVLFDQENRLRALEGAAAITQTQYRDALIARYKAL